MGGDTPSPDLFPSTPTAPRSLVRVPPLLFPQFKHWAYTLSPLPRQKKIVSALFGKIAFANPARNNC